eukprot:CAMPEP_0198124532 /NCGR_PEP_ID=MMETSP1442-20131203/40109_1 /TAXON_ID= /ORGANISM="Craspedostauros australis, Strain CCMP3328" /LENGTH=55 /DNA_ID=CAMNT_0043783941 /DNA_START=277 /DNA_END=440 /DNA_ORIENTATION=-
MVEPIVDASMSVAAHPSSSSRAVLSLHRKASVRVSMIWRRSMLPHDKDLWLEAST